jgi:hypothetical protein
MFLVSGAARDWLSRWRRDYRGHFSYHGQNQAFVAFGKGGAVFLDFGKEANFVLGKFSEHFLGVTVARRFRAGEKIGERDFHGLCNFSERLQRRHSVAVFDAGKIAAQQTRPPLDIALRKASLAPITSNYFPNIDLWLLFWHSFQDLPIWRL